MLSLLLLWVNNDSNSFDTHLASNALRALMEDTAMKETVSSVTKHRGTPNLPGEINEERQLEVHLRDSGFLKQQSGYGILARSGA